MKLDLFLFIFALALAFFSGNITYFIKSESTADFTDLNKIKNIHLEIQEELNPLIRLDLNIDYPTKEQLKLLTTEVDLNTSQKSFIDSSDCLKSNLNQRSSNFINKDTLWMTYYCNQINSLPKDFFKTPPYVSPSGHSYAFLNLKLIQSKKAQIKWLNSYAHLMNINELKKLNWSKNTNQFFLINQPYYIIKSIVAGDNIFISNQFYFIKTGNLKYFILKVDKAQRFFKRTQYNFSLDNKGCLFKVGNICWKKKKPTIHNFLSQSIILLFIGTIIILLLTANSLFIRFKRKKIDEERKKHALRVLTHELRTPIASLLVHTHQMQNYFETLAPEVQDEFLKMEGQIYRLKHLAQKSQGYLQTDSTQLIHLNMQTIDSVKEFCEDIAVEYDDTNIKIDIGNEVTLRTDPYWLKMCINNLLENAIRYGSAPLLLKVEQDSKSISISILDNGKINAKNIKELLKKKHENSKGLGLGLIIVNKTIKEMNGEFTLNTDPTEFIIKLPKNEDKA
jgi:two-component sensor histidine kinase